MEKASGTCAGCNQRFQPEDGNALCPQCQCQLEPFATTTVGDMADTVFLARQAPTGDLDTRLIGEEFDGYRIESFLGRGGMAYVFKARHLQLRRTCAIKILCPWFQGASGDSVEMFIDEARSAASITHPHVVEVHNMGEAQGYHYIELEYVPGRSLQDLLSARGKFPVLEAVSFLEQATAALAEAHHADLVHRDLKPGNMLIRDDGFLKLSDFGLAKKIVTADGAPSGSTTNLSGTPNFMAPELFRGEAATFQSDVYAVGVTLYTLLTGFFPFTGHTFPEIRRGHLEEAVPDIRREIPEIDGFLVDLIERCLAKDPAVRPEHGQALHDDLRAALLTLRDLPSLVREAFSEDPEVMVCEEAETMTITVPVQDGRRQTVCIKETQLDGQASPLVRMFSTCGVATPGIYERALQMNNRLPFGACGLDTVNGIPMLILLETVPHAACEPEHIHHSVHELARQADGLEAMLSDDDAY